MSNEAQPATANPAVAHCCNVWKRTLSDEIDNGQPKVVALLLAHKAYCNAMHPLIGHDNIRDFIACVAQGILLGAIEHAKSTKLLYAAQVALSGARSQPGSPKATAA